MKLIRYKTATETQKKFFKNHNRLYQGKCYELKKRYPNILPMEIDGIVSESLAILYSKANWKKSYNEVITYWISIVRTLMWKKCRSIKAKPMIYLTQKQLENLGDGSV